MKTMLSPAERKFLEDLLAGRIDKYSRHYQQVLKSRILKKRKELTDDMLLISRTEDKLRAL